MLVELNTPPINTSNTSSEKKDALMPPYTPHFHKVEKNFKSDTHFWTLHQNYANALHNYFSQPDSSYEHYNFLTSAQNDLYHELDYFFIHNSHVYFAAYLCQSWYDQPILNIYQFPNDSKNQVELSLLTNLHDLIAFQSGISRLDKEEYIYFLEHPKEYAYYNFLLCSCMQIDENIFIIHGNNLQPLFAMNLNPAEAKYITSNMLTYVKKHLNRKYYSVRPENPYYLYISAKGSTKTKFITYENGQLSAYLSDNDDKNILFPTTHAKYLHLYPLKSNSIVHFSSNKVFCNSFIAKFLYILTAGNINTFNNFAKLLANMAAPELITNKPFVIICPSNINASFWEMLNIIFQSITNYHAYNQDLNYPSFRQLSSSKILSTLTKIQLSKAMAIVIDDCTISKRDQDDANSMQLVKNLLKGKTLTHSHKKFGTISYSSNLPIVFMANYADDVHNLDKQMNPIIIDFNHLTPEFLSDETFLKWDTEVYDWFNINFVLYGLLISANNSHVLKSADKRNSKSDIQTCKKDALLSSFIDTCYNVTNDKKSFVYFDDIYHVYCMYITSLYNFEPATKTSVIRKLKEIYEYGRPHTSRNCPNKYAFWGFELKDNWLNTLNYHDISSQDDDFDSWQKTISKIDNLIPNELFEL